MSTAESDAPTPVWSHSTFDSEALKTSLSQIYRQEALKNERQLAYIRVVVLLISSGLDGLVYLFPQTLLNQTSVPLTIFVISLTASAIAIGFLVLLSQPRAQQRLSSLQLAIPLFDGILLGLFITNIWYVLGTTHPHIIANIAAFCCLIAVSGGVRLRSRASILTVALALGNFAYASVLFRLNIGITLFALFTILGTGLLGLSTSRIVREHSKHAAGRRLMEQFLPGTVVEAAFENPLSLLDAPTRCEVTIMVTDLRGFTRYSENLDPLEVLQTLNRVQSFLVAIVEEHGGWVDKFMGDGMLAVFGAPHSLDSHAKHAVDAGQVILQNINHVSPLPIGIGLHSGIVVAGCLGTNGHLEFTVIGDTVNVASRLEAMTKEIGTPLLMSDDTRRLLPEPSGISMGHLPIRGRDAQVQIYGLA